MALPALNFIGLAEIAKQMLAMYGTSADFFEGKSETSRKIRAVISGGENAEVVVSDMDAMPATAVLNPDDFKAPHRMPRKFDKIRINVAGFQRTYNIESVAPILAQDTLPLLMVQLKSG